MSSSKSNNKDSKGKSAIDTDICVRSDMDKDSKGTDICVRSDTDKDSKGTDICVKSEIDKDKKVRNAMDRGNNVKYIIDNAIDKYYDINKEYYNDVLIFLNLIFKQNAKSILGVYIKKIVLHEDIMIMYNNIVKKYKLNKDYVNIEAFDVDEIIDIDLIIKLMKLLTNNLLEKLNYKVVEKCKNNKKRFGIVFSGGF